MSITWEILTGKISQAGKGHVQSYSNNNYEVKFSRADAFDFVEGERFFTKKIKINHPQ